MRFADPHGHQNVAQDDGNHGEHCVEQCNTYDNTIIIFADCFGQQITGTRYYVHTLGDDGSGQCEQYARPEHPARSESLRSSKCVS